MIVSSGGGWLEPVTYWGWRTSETTTKSWEAWSKSRRRKRQITGGIDFLVPIHSVLAHVWFSLWQRGRKKFGDLAWVNVFKALFSRPPQFIFALRGTRGAVSPPPPKPLPVCFALWGTRRAVTPSQFALWGTRRAVTPTPFWFASLENGMSRERQPYP